jgi:hypothetical protein
VITQELEDRPWLRIKFASIGPGGFPLNDAGEEYQSLFSEVPAGWTVAEKGFIDTRAEGRRRAWLLTSPNLKVGAAAHETGVEILVAIGVGIAGTVAAESLIGFSKWAWVRWKQLRAAGEKQGTKIPSSLVLEKSVEQLPDGRTRVLHRLEVRGPVTEEEVQKYLSGFLSH